MYGTKPSKIHRINGENRNIFVPIGRRTVIYSSSSEAAWQEIAVYYIDGVGK